MGGGSSKQSSAQTTYDNDVVAGEGAVALGEGATLSQNYGTDIGANATLNNGVLVGDNSQFSTTSMDDNTKSMLDSALSLVGHNAANMMKLAASDSKAAQIQYIRPNEPSGGQSLDMRKTGFVVMAFVLTLAGTLLYVATRKKGKKK